MTKEEVAKKLEEISKDLNAALKLCQKENSVDDFLDNVYDLNERLCSLSKEADQVYQVDPKLKRIHKTLLEEVKRNIYLYGHAIEIE